MGGVINVIAKFNENKDSDLFMREVRVPALKLVAMYAVQVLNGSTIHYHCNLFVNL